MSETRLWLDDVRSAPPGWLHARTVAEAKELLLKGDVDEASLDHDLGLGPATCAECIGRGEKDANPTTLVCACRCHEQETGYDLCVWMARLGVWPKRKPVVHSRNVVGAERMRGVIERYFPASEGEGES
jgi:hypothetical protein